MTTRKLCKKPLALLSVQEQIPRVYISSDYRLMLISISSQFSCLSTMSEASSASIYMCCVCVNSKGSGETAWTSPCCSSMWQAQNKIYVWLQLNAKKNRVGREILFCWNILKSKKCLGQGRKNRVDTTTRLGDWNHILYFILAQVLFSLILLIWFLFYSPSTHFRSFRALSVTLTTLFLGKPPWQLTLFSAHSFTSNRQLLFLNQRKRESGRRNFFMTKSPWKNMPDVGIELGAANMPSGHTSDQATVPGFSLILTFFSSLFFFPSSM